MPQEQAPVRTDLQTSRDGGGLVQRYSASKARVKANLHDPGLPQFEVTSIRLCLAPFWDMVSLS
jgi:hypothetical protein